MNTIRIQAYDQCKAKESSGREKTMPTYAMVTRVVPELIRTPDKLEELEQRAVQAFKAHCPEVKWLHSYAILGPYDYLDPFEAPDNETAAKVSTLIRAHGRLHTEVWVATEWQQFKSVLKQLSPWKAGVNAALGRCRSGEQHTIVLLDAGAKRRTHRGDARNDKVEIGTNGRPCLALVDPNWMQP